MNPIHFNFIYPEGISIIQKNLCTRMVQFIYESRKVLLERPDICITLLMLPDIKVSLGIFNQLFLDFNQYRIAIRKYEPKHGYGFDIGEIIESGTFYSYFITGNFET